MDIQDKDIIRAVLRKIKLILPSVLQFLFIILIFSVTSEAYVIATMYTSVAAMLFSLPVLRTTAETLEELEKYMRLLILFWAIVVVLSLVKLIVFNL